MRRYFVVIPLAVLLFMGSCKQKDKFIATTILPGNGTMVDLKTNADPDQKDLYEFIGDVDFIPLETNNNLLIAEVSDVIQAGDKLLVVDKRKRVVHVFDKSGKYIRDIGKIGQGPGEYVDVTDCLYDEATNSVYICSNESGQVFRYSMDGTFISSKRVKFFPAQFLRYRDGFVFFNNDNFSDESGLNNILFLDTAFTIRKKMFPVPKDPDGTYGFSGKILTDEKSELLYNEAMRDTIFSVDTGYNVRVKYVFDFSKYSVPEDVRNTFSKFMQRGLEYSYLRNQIYESDSVLSFSYIHQRRLYNGYLNKRTQQLITGREFGKNLFTTSMSSPVGVVDGYYINAIDLNAIAVRIEETPGLRDEIKAKLPELSAILDKVKETDNPVLMRYKLKW